MRVARVSVVWALLLVGCVATPTAGPVPSAGSAPPSASSGARPITRLTAYFGPSDFPHSGKLEITSDGVRSRTRPMSAPDPDALTLFDASDGTTQVRCDSMGCLRNEVLPVSDAEAFADQCPNGTQTGTGEFIGRRTTTWICTPAGGEPLEAIFDAEYPATMLKATLNAGYQWEAESFQVGVQVPDDFFAIDRPGLNWKQPTPTRVTPPKPGKEGARLPRLGGGTLALTDYTGGPVLIVIGDEDELRRALARIERVHGKDLPRLAGVLLTPTGPESLPTQRFPVPVAVNPPEDGGDAWRAMTGQQQTPTAVFCGASGKGCMAVAIPELSDAELAARIGKLA